MGVVSHHGSCGLSCVKVISKERRGSNKREDNCHGSSLIDGDPSGGGIGVRETWMIYHLVVLYVKLMLEVTIYLLDQTWESSLVPIERLMLQHRQRWHLVSHTFLGGFVLESYLPVFELSDSDDAIYWMSSPCWRHHLGVFSREVWACRTVSVSMLMVQSTYAGSDPISYHDQRWCF
jgi:hypothetical protein